ncbi:MAG: hypothetical protein M3151_09165 [Actinomycetota bacterium]|nr:hypothetical protein [Actinomycetota bacterium]
MARPHTGEIVDLIAGPGAFVVACIVLDASMLGITGEQLEADPRAGAKLPPAWLATLHSSFNRYPQGRLDGVLGYPHLALPRRSRDERRSRKTLVAKAVAPRLQALGSACRTRWLSR